MPRSSHSAVLLLFASLLGLLVWPGLYAGDPKAAADAKADAPAEFKPEERDDAVKRGLAFLAEQQRPDGGWATQARFGAGAFLIVPARPGAAKPAQEPSDLGCTCLALLALVRAGNTPTNGDYSKNVAKAVDYITHAVAKSSSSTLGTNERNGTQLQIKIGPHVDTFLCLLTLSELKGKLKDEKAEERLATAVRKLIAKIEAHQKKDGTYPQNRGWAPVLSQGVASKALNRASQAGFAVKTQTLARDYEVLVQNLDRKTGRFGVTAKIDPKELIGRSAVGTRGSAETGKGDVPSMILGDAGVALYSAAARAGGLQELANSLRLKEDKARKVLADKEASSEARQVAKKQLELMEKTDDAAALGLRGITGQVADKKFVTGFGSNGGEEFLSFLLISEALKARGGDEWDKWDKLASTLVLRAQDKDGAWSGQHCITGRTPCTATALLTLLASRAPAMDKGEMK